MSRAAGPGARLAFWTIAALGLAATLAAIWLPLIRHYRAVIEPVDAAVVDRVRRPLPLGVGELLAWRDFDVPVRAEGSRLVSQARRLLGEGRVHLPPFPERVLAHPFAAEDLARGRVTWQLQVAGLVGPRLLLDAYRETGNRDFLRGAAEAALAFAAFEGDAWLPRGLLWNDHAIAARVIVLADLWDALRAHPDLLAEREAVELLRFVSRNVRLIERADHYTARTNHGVMQALALWHATLAFPGLPEAADSAAIGHERMVDHMPYYLGPEGVVLEHSVGYHRIGLSLIGRMFRYMELAGQPVPAEWRQRFAAAREFYKLTLRPDGSLPRIGDTHPASGRRPLDLPGTGTEPTTPDGEDRGSARASGWALYPVSGYAIRNDRGGTWDRLPRAREQTILAWSRFPEFGHKHADELSLHYWRDGIDWWTAVGYWPYGTTTRRQAVGWTSSNAPHRAGEPAGAERRARLEHHGADADGNTLVELLRAGPGDYRVRRQYFETGNGWHGVIDTAAGADAPTESIWRTAPGVAVTRLAERRYRLTEPDRDASLDAWFLGYESVRNARGEAAPGVTGFVARQQQRVPTEVLIARRPSDGRPGLVIWRPAGSAAPTGEPRLASWNGVDAWRLALPGTRGETRLDRDGASVAFAAAGGAASTLTLGRGPDVTAARERIRAAYARAEARYGDFRALLPYRWRVTGLAAAALGGQLLLGGVAGSWGRRWWLAVALSALGWLGLIAWLRLYYFVY